MRLRITLLLAFVLALLPPPDAVAISPTVVVSQVYGGGGNAGATYNRDFIELFNRSKQTVDLTKWHVQYAPSTSDRWVSTTLGGTIAPFRYYLVALDGGSSGGTVLPTPDAAGSTNMSGTAGKVRVLNGADATVDLVAYGSSTPGGEGKAAPGTSDTKQSVTRKRGACTDTDNNLSDFALVAVKPHNHSAAANRCDSPPTLNPIGNRSGHAGTQLAFTLAAWDPDGDALTYSASGLPAGATFYPESRTFAWRPAAGDVAMHPGVRFSVFDGFSVDAETITIGVAPPSTSGGAKITLRVARLETEIRATGAVSPDHRNFEVVVRIFRKSNGAYVLLAEQRPWLDANSAYRVVFARPRGMCQVRARFPGDELHDRAVQTTEFRC